MSTSRTYTWQSLLFIASTSIPWAIDCCVAPIPRSCRSTFCSAPRPSTSTPTHAHPRIYETWPDTNPYRRISVQAHDHLVPVKHLFTYLPDQFYCVVTTSAAVPISAYFAASSVLNFNNGEEASIVALSMSKSTFHAVAVTAEETNFSEPASSWMSFSFALISSPASLMFRVTSSTEVSTAPFTCCRDTIAISAFRNFIFFG
mmetsp:Transcript_10208/g.25076  ORF Transcript_10208/g.25076 Transcript_10208/m.25076 type:complete len:202 (-) Transcript_10208:276-881(-)